MDMSESKRGRIECGESAPVLVIERRLAHSRDEVWRTLTESERTARWIGSWTGKGAPGETIQVTWTAEEGAPTDSMRIVECDAPHRLSLSGGPDPKYPYLVTITLDETNGSTQLEFRQLMWGEATPAMLGTGWEFYLDRLEGVLDDQPELPAWDDRYTALQPHYEELQAAMALCESE